MKTRKPLPTFENSKQSVNEVKTSSMIADRIKQEQDTLKTKIGKLEELDKVLVDFAKVKIPKKDLMNSDPFEKGIRYIDGDKTISIEFGAKKEHKDTLDDFQKEIKSKYKNVKTREGREIVGDNYGVWVHIDGLRK